ncbi:MAG: phosphatase PAP2 family protein [Xanthomonadales bacterium]|nr:phosphatase PAP2 family protein [Xanthomonadales bacterium]
MPLPPPAHGAPPQRVIHVLTLNLAGRRLWRWLPLLVLLVATACGAALTRCGPAIFDESLLLWFRSRNDTALIAGPAWVTTFWSSVSWLGDALPRIVAAVMALIALLWFRRRRDALLMSGVLLSGLMLSSAIKQWVARPRPQLVAHLDHVSSASFPSGHALNSTLFYMTIALLLAPLLRRHSGRLVLYGVAIALSLMIGVSRVALGVHYPSDVLASWLISAAWLWLWFAAAKYHCPK